jgi:hypothetical protein
MNVIRNILPATMRAFFCSFARNFRRNRHHEEKPAKWTIKNWPSKNGSISYLSINKRSINKLSIKNYRRKKTRACGFLLSLRLSLKQR